MCTCQRGGILRKAREGGVVVPRPRWVRIDHDGSVTVACNECGREHRVLAPRGGMVIPVHLPGAPPNRQPT